MVSKTLMTSQNLRFFMELIYLFLTLLLPAVRGSNAPECWTRHRGVCVEMQSGSCPFSGGGFTWQGCPPEHICCIPPISAATRKPPENNDNCGVSKTSGLGKFRIIGGWKSLPGEWPWQVSLRKDEQHICGAVIIDRHWIMTAAHCFIIGGYPTGHWDVVIGQYDLYRYDGFEQYRNLSHIIMHESFNNPAFSNDIALMKVDIPIHFNNYSNKICLPQNDEKFEDIICSVSGWGTDYVTSKTRFLHEVNLPIVPFAKCKAIHKENLHVHNLCTGFRAGKRDTCQGDSGGPLVCLKNGNYWVLAGITSWGEMCAKENMPAVFTSVKYFLDWIKEKTNLDI